MLVIVFRSYFLGLEGRLPDLRSFGCFLWLPIPGLWVVVCFLWLPMPGLWAVVLFCLSRAVGFILFGCL